MALTKHFKKILKNSTFSIVSDPGHSYCMVEYYTGFGDSRNCDTYYVLKSVLLPVLEQTKSVKTLLAVAIENRLLGSNDTRLTEIPPTTTTDTKSESCVIADSVGVVDSVGDALFNTLEISLLRQVFNSFDLMSLPANFEAGSQLFALKQKIDLLHFKNFPKGV